MASVAAPTMSLLLMYLFVDSVPLARAGGLRGSSAGISTSDVESSLISELISVVSDGRPAELEAALLVTFASLPKNSYGNLDHQAVRYVLHRMFVQQHGWFIKGLEPDGTGSSSVSSLEWVPSYIQNLVEKRLGSHGMSLKELSTMAATLESLIHKESGQKLRVAYNVNGFSTEERLSEAQLQSVIGSYMMEFLEPGEWGNSTMTAREARATFEEFKGAYAGWPAVEEWYRGVEAPHLQRAQGSFNFAATWSIMEDIAQKFANFNDGECRRLKATLIEMEDKQLGRVRLSEFYKKSLYSHWQFTEKKEYLRQLGALDESDPKNVQVISANYVGSRPNCLEASSIYAICCRNECEDLMGSIEREVGAPTAPTDRVAKLVAGLASDTVQAPRELSPRLLGRLNQVAANNGGAVHLHGRLFAQWMHHAFPRECPFPHEVGTTNPMTPDAWLKASGHDSIRTSEAELREHVEASPDVQQLSLSGDADSDELPWSHAEELLMPVQPSAGAGSLRSCSRAFAGLLLLAAIGMVVHSSYTKGRRGAIIGVEEDGPVKPAKENAGTAGVLVAFCGLSVIVLVFDLLDPTIFVGAFLVGTFPIALQWLVPHGPMAKKCV